MLLERDHIIAEINRTIAELQSSGKIILVSGEAGIGKTSLIEHVYKHVDPNIEVFWSGCDPLFTPRPYAPIYDIAAQLDPKLQTLLESGTHPGKVFSSFFQAVKALERSSIIIIEDLHWADNASLDLLKFFVRRIALVPCILCVTYRNDEVTLEHPLNSVLRLIPSAHTLRLALQPLSIEAVSSMAENTAQNPQHLHEITAGNPFFVSELLATKDYKEASIPASVRDAVNARIGALQGAERTFLQTLSLIPYGIPHALIEYLFAENAEKLANTSLDRNLLLCDNKGDFRFRHELARLATISSLALHQQKKIHRQILEGLESLSITHNLAWLVHHAEGALDAKRLLEYGPMAAVKAANLGAHKEAASYYEKALEYAAEADSELAASLYENWAYEVGLTTHMKQSVIDARKHAITLYKALGRPEKVGQNLRWLSRLYWYQGDAERAEYFANEAIKVFESLPSSSDLAMAYSLRSQLDMLNDRTDEAVMWGNKALAVEQDFPSPGVKVHALNNIGSALVMSGQESGEAYLQQSIALAEEHGLHEDVARVYTNYSDYCVRFKKLNQAETLINAGIQFDVSHDLDSWTYYLVGIQAQLRLEQGRLSDAEAIAAGVQDLENQTLLMKLPALSVLAKVRSRMGAVDAKTLLESALQNAIATDENQYIIPLRLSLIEHAWLNGEIDLAIRHLDWLLTVAFDILNIWQRGELLVWQKRLGYTKVLAYELPVASPYEFELAGKYHQAYECWCKLGVPYNAALALLHAPTEVSSAQYEKICSTLTDMQATGLINWLKNDANLNGYSHLLPKPTRGPYAKSRKHPAGLTSKEQLVLNFILDGASNTDIAVAMSRSQRTVENHVSSILNKLEVENRIEAMLRVQNEPWLAGDIKKPPQ